MSIDGQTIQEDCLTLEYGTDR